MAKATAMSREFLAGLIIAYPYLWAWQNDRGETEGRKSSLPASSSRSVVRRTASSLLSRRILRSLGWQAESIGSSKTMPYASSSSHRKILDSGVHRH